MIGPQSVRRFVDVSCGMSIESFIQTAANLPYCLSQPVLVFDQ
jgi:hypothetical protein